MVEDSLDAVKQGFDILKVKVGKEGEKDVERIAAIRKAVGPNVLLRVDANQGWEAEEAVRIIRAMERKGLGLDLVEQPVPAEDVDGLSSSPATSIPHTRRRGGVLPPATRRTSSAAGRPT